MFFIRERILLLDVEPQDQAVAQVPVLLGNNLLGYVWFAFLRSGSVPLFVCYCWIFLTRAGFSGLGDQRAHRESMEVHKSGVIPRFLIYFEARVCSTPLIVIFSTSHSEQEPLYRTLSDSAWSAWIRQPVWPRPRLVCA